MTDTGTIHFVLTPAELGDTDREAVEALVEHDPAAGAYRFYRIHPNGDRELYGSFLDTTTDPEPMARMLMRQEIRRDRERAPRFQSPGRLRI